MSNIGGDQVSLPEATRARIAAAVRVSTLQMFLHRAGADSENPGDLAVDFTCRHKRQDLALATRQGQFFKV